MPMKTAPVIDVHTHVLTHEFVSLLERHGGPDYSLKTVTGGLPPGPMVVWFGENQSMPVAQLGASALGVERVIFLPLSMEDPRNPGSLLAERVNLTVFDTMLEQLNQ